MSSLPLLEHALRSASVGALTELGWSFGLIALAVRDDMAA
jgi:hypothetical protein